MKHGSHRTERFAKAAFAGLSAAAALLAAPVSSPASTAGPSQTISGALDGTSAAASGAAAAYDETRDRYLIAWTAPQDLSSTIAVWARFATPDGQPSGRAFRIAVVESGIEGRHAGSIRLLYLPATRRYLAVFTGPRNASFPDELEAYAQWLDDDGDPVGGTVPISRGSVGSVKELRSAVDPEGTAAAVVYTATRPARPTATVYAQVISPGSVSLPTVVFETADASDAPSVVFSLALGRFVVAGATTAPSGLRSLALTSIDGLPPTPSASVPVADIAPAALVSTALTAGADGRARVAWSEQQGGTFTVRTAKPADDGTAGTAPTVASGAASSGTVSVDLSDDGSRGLLAAWNVPGTGTSTVELLPGGDPAEAPTLTAPGAASQLGGIGGSLGRDRIRGGWLLPWTVSTPGIPRTTRQVFARTVTPPPPPPEAPLSSPEQVVVPAAPLCIAPLQPFATKAGAECGGIPVPSFQVATVRTQARRARLLGLVVSPTVAGQRVRVSCVVRCKGRASTIKRKGRKRSTSLPFSSWKAAPPARAVIDVRVEAAGRTTRYRRFRVTASHPYLAPSADGCVLPTGRTASC